jgi:hypothetical protein
LKAEELEKPQPPVKTGPAKALVKYNEATKVPRESWMQIPKLRDLRTMCALFPVRYTQLDDHEFVVNGETRTTPQYAIYWLPLHICESLRSQEDDYEIIMEYYGYKSFVLMVSLIESPCWSVVDRPAILAMNHSETSPIATIRMNYNISGVSTSFTTTTDVSDDLQFAAHVAAQRLGKPVAAIVATIVADNPPHEVMARVLSITKISDVRSVFPIIWVRCDAPYEMYSVRVAFKVVKERFLDPETVKRHALTFIRACNHLWTVTIHPDLVRDGEFCRVHYLH